MVRVRIDQKKLASSLGKRAIQKRNTLQRRYSQLGFGEGGSCNDTLADCCNCCSQCCDVVYVDVPAASPPDYLEECLTYVCEACHEWDQTFECIFDETYVPNDIDGYLCRYIGQHEVIATCYVQYPTAFCNEYPIGTFQVTVYLALDGTWVILEHLPADTEPINYTGVSLLTADPPCTGPIMVNCSQGTVCTGTTCTDFPEELEVTAG